MNQRLFLSCICLLLLVSLAFVPVLAATGTCPSGCSCLESTEAKKLGLLAYCRDEQMVCGYDLNMNAKYCFTKPVTTTTVPQLKCASGCTCISTAEGKGRGLAYCNNRQMQCGVDTDKTPLYCFALRVATTSTGPTIVTALRVITTAPTTVPGKTAPTIVTGLHVMTTVPTPAPVPAGLTERCAAGCSCLPADKADAAGIGKCSGTTTPCGFDPSGRPKYCYRLDYVTMVTPASDGPPADIPSLPPSDGPVPAVPASDGPIPAIEQKTTTPAPSDNAPPDIFAAIGNFIASIFGGHERPATAGPASGTMLACGPGTTFCGSTCTDTSSDRTNCGGCGITCYGGEACCNGHCTSIIGSPMNCGGCGRTCPPGWLCTGGLCNSSACREGMTTCGGACTLVQSDPLNCGTCHRVCANTSRCVDGDCVSCSEGSVRCGTQNSCIDLMTDRSNCGACRYACAGVEICRNGICTSCPAGTTACSALWSASECADLRTSEDHCGRCGYACWLFEGDNMYCIDGVCRPPGYSVMQVQR